MQRISRAEDTIWSTAAFDPRKPVDPDWASKDPAPVLRSGDEHSILRDSPAPHGHGSDRMTWTPEGHGSDDDIPGEEYDDDPDDSHRYSVHGDVSDDDLRAMGNHMMKLVVDRAGKFEGSGGHYVEYPTDSSVSHYYTHHGDRLDLDPNKRWSLESTHHLLRDAPHSYHPTFESAVAQSRNDRSRLEAMADREWPD